jgi:hypothetical protein
MKEVKAESETARNMIDMCYPEEVREQALPGWLRE